MHINKIQFSEEMGRVITGGIAPFVFASSDISP